MLLVEKKNNIITLENGLPVSSQAKNTATIRPRNSTRYLSARKENMCLHKDLHPNLDSPNGNNLNVHDRQMNKQHVWHVQHHGRGAETRSESLCRMQGDRDENGFLLESITGGSGKDKSNLDERKFGGSPGAGVGMADCKGYKGSL